MFPTGTSYPHHLAYVEWFKAFSSTTEKNHLMYKVTREYRGDQWYTSIIPVSKIQRSVHLIPKFGPVANYEWSSSNVLEQCSTFYLNPFTDRHTYITVY